MLKGLDKEDNIGFQVVLMSEDVHYKQIFTLKGMLHYVVRRSRKDFSTFSKIGKIVKDFKPDVIHCWDSMTAIYALPASKWYGIKFVNSMVTSMPVKRNILNKYYLRARITFPWSDLVIGNSKAGLKGYRAPESKSLCIYNGLDFSRFSNLKDVSEVSRELNIKSEKDVFMVGMVAAFDPRKDYPAFVRTALNLASRDEKYLFVMEGDGSELESIRSLVPVNLQDRILFTGRRNDVESIVNLFDVGVLTTSSKVHGEGVSNSIIEYMALSKPVIATRGGGTDEVVTYDENGYLIDYGDSEALIDRILFCQ